MREVHLADFDDYRDYLETKMSEVAMNMASPARRHSLSMLGTLSSGYDSATVATIAATAGCKEAICFDRSRDGGPDSGEAVARDLGMRPLRVSRNAWRRDTLPEAPFIAASPGGGLQELKGAERHLAGRLLLTGFYGGSIWGHETKNLAADTPRKDASGLSLTEYRLRVGFIHCPPAFWATRQIRDVVAISRSAEMRPWVLGKTYQRPICRRIVEEAGVPRHAFGAYKRQLSGSVVKHEEVLTPDSMADYLAWLRRQRRGWSRRRQLPIVASARVDRMIWRAVQLARTALRRVSGVRRLRANRPLRSLRRRLKALSRSPIYLRRYIMHWAMERAKESYSMPHEVTPDGEPVTARPATTSKGGRTANASRERRLGAAPPGAERLSS